MASVSIIIPAYNEESVIQRTLSHLTEGAPAGELDVIVCCNACSDRTAEIVRQFGPPVRVLETAKGSKPHAMNLGDEAATAFPRIYLDADVLLSYTAVKSIVQALEDPKNLAVAPRIHVDLDGRPWAVRAYYDVWLKTPYHLRGMIGSGVFALSETGRNRFGEFPETFADDGYVRAHFGPNERRILDDCCFTIASPTSFGTLLKIKTRVALGNRQLVRNHPELMERLAQLESGARGRTDYWNLVKRPALWPRLGVYAFVKTVAAVQSRSQFRRLSTHQWTRDETTRV